MATVAMNPATGKPVSEDWFWSPQTQPQNHPLFLPGGGFNATWQDPYVGTPQAQQAPVQQQQQPASAMLADLVRQQPAASAPAANPFADALANSYKAPPPAAPTVAPYRPQAIPAAPKLQTATALTTTPQLTQAEQRLQDLITNPSALQDSASYKFRVQQGQQALERSLGARGLLRSGNRLTELTKYGQDMGSQEYEAENARRKAVLDAYLGNLRDLNTSNIAAVGVNNQGATSIYGTQAGAVSNANQTAASAKAAADQIANNQYLAQLDAMTKQQGTLANLYSNADTTGTQRYGIDTTAGTARLGTLADLYRTDTQAELDRLKYEKQPLSPKPWWQV